MHALSASQHSLVSWFVQSGVTHIVGVPSWVRPAPVAQPPANDAAIIQLKPVETTSIPTFNSMESFNDFLKTWKDLGLCKTAGQAVLGHGKAEVPDLMVITDFPDAEEDKNDIAFSGTANKMIVTALAAAGFNYDNAYCTYLSKWRPPGQRNLAEYEVSALIPLLQQEIGLVKPRAILLLGDTPLRAIFGKSTQKAQILTKKTSIEIQVLGKSLPILTSPKSEFLVKNRGMKKSFWFSLIDFAATIRAQGL